jgi:hypothetical protein
MKKLISFILTSLMLSISWSCDDNGNSSGAKVYKAVSEVHCPFDNSVIDVSNDDVYIEFDNPNYRPTANTWYRDSNNYYWKIGVDASPKNQLSHRVLIAEPHTTYCQ